MIERPMPQDVLKYKAKLIGNLSARECVATLASVALVGIGYATYGHNIDQSGPLKVILSAIPALPAWIIGFMPIMGMPAEKVAIPLFIDNFWAPAVRKKEIHFKDYEKYCKMNYDELQEFNAKIAAGEGMDEQVEEEREKNGKGKKQKPKKQKEFRVKRSEEYKGIR